MKNTNTHNLKEFFIRGKMLLIRPLHASDTFANSTYQQLLSSGKFTSLGELEYIPGGTLQCISNMDNSFVYIVISEEHENADPLGFALYGKNNLTGRHEMSVLVTDHYIDTRLAYELADSLIRDAAAHNVTTLNTVDRKNDKNLRSLALKLGMTVRLQPADRRTIKYSLQADEYLV